MKDQKPIRTARRRTRQVNRLSADHPFCLHCGCSEVALLRPVTKRFLEAHHVVGENHDSKLTVLLCRNCHYMATENLLRAAVSMVADPNPIKRVALILRALAVHLEMLAEACRSWANLLGNTN